MSGLQINQPTKYVSLPSVMAVCYARLSTIVLSDIDGLFCASYNSGRPQNCLYYDFFYFLFMKHVLLFLAVLVLFLYNQLKFSEDTSTAIYHGFIVLCYLLPLFGALISDSCLGKYG